MLQTAYLGDMVLTAPLLEALAKRHGPVDVVTTSEAAPLIETHHAVRTVLRYDKRSTMRGVVGMYRVARDIARRRYGWAYLPHRSIASSLIARLAGIPRRVGFADAAGRWWYTSRVERAGVHEAERLLSLAGRAAPAMPSIVLTSADRRIAARVLRSAGVEQPFVAVAPGSAWKTKRWPHYRELARRIGVTRSVVVIGSRRERGVLAASGGEHPSIDLAGQLGIRESAAVIADSAALVANDSVAVHLAQATGTPVVAVYGPTSPAFGFGPRGPADRVVQLDGLPCRPCSTHGSERCPLSHHRCMQDLSVDTVERALAGVLDGSRSKPTRRPVCTGS